MSPPTAPGVFQETQLYNKHNMHVYVPSFVCVCVCVCVGDFTFLFNSFVSGKDLF